MRVNWKERRKMHSPELSVNPQLLIHESELSVNPKEKTVTFIPFPY